MKKKLTVEELEKIREELSDQLIQSERIRSLGTLSGGVAHHFNNLLSVILGYSSFVLNREELSKEATDALHRISEAAQRGRRLTEELLAFAGSEVEEETVCHVHDTISSVLSLLQSQVHSRVHIETHLDAGSADITAAASSIHQVVFNLLTNALDSMPEGGELTVTTSNVELGEKGKALQHLRIVVADTSGSLPQGFGGDGQTTAASPEDHSGLRLSSVYGIVGKLDGTVLASSEPGQQTQVEILLPTAQTQASDADSHATDTRLTPSSIWVVDDDPVFREMCAVVLREQGHELKQMSGGKELHKKWAANKVKPDLIIIDFSMPDYNGLELCEWLKKQGSTVPVVLVSGLSISQPDIRKALDMKRTFFLQKPFTFRELADVVTVAMGETLIGE